MERLDKAECLRLISPGGIGRIAYSGRSGVTVLPVSYKWYQGTIVFRTAQDSPLDEDLRTGIAGAEYKVAFEVDDVDLEAREGWSVLIQGSAHHVDTESERASVLEAGVEPWPDGERGTLPPGHPQPDRRPAHPPGQETGPRVDPYPTAPRRQQAGHVLQPDLGPYPGRR